VSAPLDIMAMSADEAAEHLANMRVAIADMEEVLSAKRAQEDPDAPRAPKPLVIIEDPETALVFEALQRGRASSNGSAPAREQLKVRWVTDAITNPPPKPDVLIEGLLDAGELTVIGAGRGIGKSWLVLNIATLLGRGVGLLFGHLLVKKACKVLIVQGENSDYESWRRWRVLNGSDAPEGVAETFDRIRVRITRKRSTASSSIDGQQSSDTTEWVQAELDERLEAAIVEHGFEVVVIDPWAVFYCGNENSNDEVEEALEKLKDLSMRLGVAIIIVHHFGKSLDVREPEDLWRGASRLADWASTRVTLRQHYTAKQAKDQGMTREQARRYADVLFLRRSLPTPDFSIVLDPETCWWSRWVPPAEVAESRKAHLDVPDVVDACREAGGAWPSLSHAADDLGVSRTTARKVFASALRSGAIETSPGLRGAVVYRLPGAHLGDENEVER
jgi:hypothetical protein